MKKLFVIALNLVILAQEKKASAAPRSVQKFSTGKPAAAPRSNTNRPGSAMSLRAGARRGLGGSGKR